VPQRDAPVTGISANVIEGAAWRAAQEVHVRYRKTIAGLVALSIVGTVGLAAASGASTPSRVTITQLASIKFKANRYVQDGLRWNKDVYEVKSGGTIKVVNTAADEGPHTFTVVKKSDLPTSFRCPICDKLFKAHGADPNSQGPPKFQFLENGVGQATAPNVDRPGDSGITGQGKKGESITLKVTARKGTTLTFMCIIHPWMQAKVLVK
jgi:plastocyanin